MMKVVFPCFSASTMQDILKGAKSLLVRARQLCIKVDSTMAAYEMVTRTAAMKDSNALFESLQ